MRRFFSILAPIVAIPLAWMAVTSLSTSSAVSTWAPCPRNWGWLPAYLARESPLVALPFRMGDAHVKVCYGSPSLRGRKMIGGDSVPFGELWRTGANEPTTIHVDRRFRFGALALPAGSYSIYTIPGAGEWQVIVNRATRQWGLESEYTAEVASHEVGRFALAPERLASSVERLQFRAEPAATGATDLLLEWQNTRIRIPLAEGYDETEPIEQDMPNDLR